MAEVLCPNCGRPNNDYHEFCDFCGNPLDGALRVEGNSDSPIENFFQDQPPESGDDESRLDSLVPAPEEEIQPTPGEKFMDDTSLNGGSRLENYFSDQDDLDKEPSPGDADSDPFNGGSRLDDYLPVENGKTDREPEDLREDETSLLDDFIPAEEPGEEIPLDMASLSEDQEDDTSRLDDYLTTESPQDQKAVDDADRLNEFFADDPFKSPDPFFEPSTSKTEENGEEPRPEAIDAGEWDFLEPKSEPGKPGEDIPPGAIDAGEWDFLDPTPDPEITQEEESQAKEAEGWDFPDPHPAQEESGVESTPESTGAEEWDFLDPAPEDSEQVEMEPSPESAKPEISADWSFLDPGPTDDLSEKASGDEFTAEGDEEDAGWLDMLQDPESRQRLEPEPGLTSEPQRPQTDWLDKIKRLNKSSDLVDEDSSFPDWLSVTGKTGPIDTGESEESDEVPDWLQLDDDESLDEFLRKKDLTNEEYKPKVTTDSLDETEVPADQDAPGTGLSDSQQIKFPSWAEEQKQKALKRRQAKPVEGPGEGELESVEAFQIEDEHFDDLFSEELPSWLTATPSGEIDRTFGEELAQGELPGWVEAMRPVVESTDASGLDEDEEYIENYGPLAGIPSVLPAEAEIGIDVDQAVQKPLTLMATKSHQNYVDLLKKLIGDENKSKTILIPSPLQSQRVLRWLIAIVMLVAIAGTLIFSGVAEVEPPTVAQVQGTGFNALYEEIETLYDGQPVLIAFDYQPAAAGELHTAAAAVVDHLMEEGTYLSLVSTLPTGPALAEHFLNTTQSHHNYIHTQKYINLGYLPGESAGLVSFMISPQKIIPLAFDGSNAWDSPPLISIDGIKDFKMILVITDDPNTAKIWIEQVGSRLDDTPLTMVVSAQVEPLIQPYFRTSPQQVKGYVAGIIDSINYEMLTERPYLANRIWLPFNMGIVISVGLIFISGLANGLLSLFARRKDLATGDSK